MEDIYSSTKDINFALPERVLRIQDRKNFTGSDWI